MKIAKIEHSTRKGKRFTAVFTDSTRVHFGQAEPVYGAYIDHQDDARRLAYLARHSKNNEDWTDRSPGALSRWLLWEHPTLAQAVRAWNRRHS